jgi:transcriptional regulator with XRE-family HTH domain
MQYRQTDLMVTDIRSRTPFAQRLVTARKAVRLTQKDVEIRLGIPQSTLSELEHSANSSGYTAQLAALYGVDAHFLAKGVPAQAARPPLVHDMSQAKATLPIPRLRWEDLMTADLSQPFELEVVDDALGPDIWKGCIARLVAGREPEPGRPVLVRDRDGRHYLRDYQSNGGRWQAVARTRGYPPLDSEEHGLILIAVMKGFDWP